MLPFSLPRPSGPPKFPPAPPVSNMITMPREEYAALKAAAVRLAEEAADLRAKVLRAEEELAKLRARTGHR
jgi:predicted  nucleic acid-binding Zn-ribbon protein